MPRLDHRKLESLISPGGVPALQGDGEDAVYNSFTLAFVVYEWTISGSLVHTRPPAELFKIVAYSVSCLLVYRSVPMYLRLMLIWTITTAFSGVLQPLLWLDNASGSVTEQRLVRALLALSIAGMAGNILGALTVFPSTGVSSGKAQRRRYRTPVKES
eukprot:g14862.t1